MKERTSEKVLEIIERNDFKRGIYVRGDKRKTYRYLLSYDGEIGGAIFITYMTKSNFMKAYYGKAAEFDAQNANTTSVLDWFIGAEYLGENPVKAGLIEEADE